MNGGVALLVGSFCASKERSSTLYSQRGHISVADAVALRTALAYPANKTVWLKMYSVSDEVLAVYPSIKLITSTIYRFGFLRSFLERRLFGESDTVMPLYAFRIVMALGRKEIDELTASQLLKRSDHS
jgi:hypothetical protein